MSKLLWLIFAIAALWWLAKGFRRRNAAKDEPEAAPEQQMVNCSHCGLYLPTNEDIADGDKYFCSAEHRRLAA
jgi:uncharacterized protein